MTKARPVIRRGILPMLRYMVRSLGMSDWKLNARYFTKHEGWREGIMTFTQVLDKVGNETPEVAYIVRRVMEALEAIEENDYQNIVRPPNYHFDHQDPGNDDDGLGGGIYAGMRALRRWQERFG